MYFSQYWIACTFLNTGLHVLFSILNCMYFSQYWIACTFLNTGLHVLFQYMYWIACTFFQYWTTPNFVSYQHWGQFKWQWFLILNAILVIVGKKLKLRNGKCSNCSNNQVKVGTHQINTIKRSVQVGWFWILIILQAYRVTLYKFAKMRKWPIIPLEVNYNVTIS